MLTNRVFLLTGIAVAALVAGLEFLGIPPLLTPLQAVPALTLVLLAYGSIHSPEIVYFYGMRAEAARSLGASRKILNLA